MSNDIETANKFVVCVGGGGIAILNPPRRPMTPDEALVLAAWLVALAEVDAAHSFDDVQTAVNNT